MPDAPKRKRVLSGMRPTGHLHIGHYFGALKNWIKMQDEYECFYCVVDWHALTSDYADSSQIAQNTIEIAIDWLAAGLDPQKSTFFVQSQVPEHAELHLLLSMVTPLSWLERVPTYKEQLDNIKGKNLHTYGFLGYPVLQAADIVMYNADVVPVGEDQASHIELTREIVRTFNSYFGFRVDYARWKNENEPSLIAAVYPVGAQLTNISAGDPSIHSRAREINTDVLRRQILEEGRSNFLRRIGKQSQRYVTVRDVLLEPRVQLTDSPRVPGTDGRKMSKSYGNAIMLSEKDDSIRAKTKLMVTDPARKRRTDPGNPDICPVYDWHKLFSPRETLDWAAQGCRTAGIGCIECKGAMADHLIRWIAPVRARRQEFEAHPERVKQILAAGSAHARGVARNTMARVREAVFGAAQFELPAPPSASAGAGN